MTDLNFRRFFRTTFKGSVLLLIFLGICHVHAYLVVSIWALFVTNSYFYFRIEMVLVRIALAQQAEAEMIRSRLDVILQRSRAS